MTTQPHPPGAMLFAGPAGDPIDDLMLPDDYRYAFIVVALDHIAEWTPDEDRDTDDGDPE